MLKNVMLLSLMLGTLLLRGVDISKVDANFSVATLGKKTFHYYNALKAPFQVNGFPWRKEGGRLYRLPETWTDKEVPAGLLFLATHTAGGTIRFQSDSPEIALRTRILNGSEMNTMPRTGTAGFDVFQENKPGGTYFNTIQLNRAQLNGKRMEQLAVGWGKQGEMRAWTIYLPLYSGIKMLEIGIRPGCRILPPKPQNIKDPILFYGSSITQGACASRSSNCYSSLLCRILDAPQINLGFSGNAKGEAILAEAISKLKLSAFVYDYDYNAPTVEHLRKTHEAFFKIIRRAQPNLPIIMMSRITYMQPARRDIVKATYDHARQNGDQNVYFIDGAELLQPAGLDICTVDHCHPTDVGFYMMYQRILPVLRKALSKQE